MNYALTIYPLSQGYRARLAAALQAEPRYMSLAELRSLPVAHAIRRLRGLRGSRLILALEDESSRCILPVLQTVAALSNADAVEIRSQDRPPQPLTRAQLAASLLSLAGASMRSASDAAACNRELARLVAAPRAAAPLASEGEALYLNANLWFGVKAGGSVGHIAGVVNALEASGQRVTYASAAGRAMIRPDVPVVTLAPPETFGLPYELNYYTFHRRVMRQLRGRPAPRFVYQRMSIANFAGVALSRAWGVPLVLEYNGSEVWIARNWGRALRFHNLAARAEEACL